MTVTRGTSNGNESGSSYDRRRRKLWLLEHYRADVDLAVGVSFLQICGEPPEGMQVPTPGRNTQVPIGKGSPACRCYRCGALLTFETLTVDRIVPGCQGGTYRRNNIRPACAPCNSSTGGATRRKK